MKNFKKYYVLDGPVKAKFENPADPVRIIKAREERKLRLPTVGVAARAGERSRYKACLLYTSPSPRDRQKSRMPSSA